MNCVMFEIVDSYQCFTKKLQCLNFDIRSCRRLKKKWGFLCKRTIVVGWTDLLNSGMNVEKKQHFYHCDFRVNYDLTTDWPEVAFIKKLLCVVWRCIFPRPPSIAVCTTCMLEKNVKIQKQIVFISVMCRNCKPI